MPLPLKSSVLFVIVKSVYGPPGPIRFAGATPRLLEFVQIGEMEVGFDAGKGTTVEANFQETPLSMLNPPAMLTLNTVLPLTFLPSESPTESALAALAPNEKRQTTTRNEKREKLVSERALGTGFLLEILRAGAQNSRGLKGRTSKASEPAQ
jgi:hypothetical protein